MVQRRVLMWKFEDGTEDAPEEGSPDDVGPAWIDTFEDGQHIGEEKYRAGEWITRAEAQRAAAENGWEFEADD